MWNCFLVGSEVLVFFGTQSTIYAIGLWRSVLNLQQEHLLMIKGLVGKQLIQARSLHQSPTMHAVFCGQAHASAAGTPAHH
jgi:hypothetical protein